MRLSNDGQNQAYATLPHIDGAKTDLYYAYLQAASASTTYILRIFFLSSKSYAKLFKFHLFKFLSIDPSSFQTNDVHADSLAVSPKENSYDRRNKLTLMQIFAFPYFYGGHPSYYGYLQTKVQQRFTASQKSFKQGCQGNMYVDDIELVLALSICKTVNRSKEFNGLH